uniref:THUMP domain-containing protein n=2 Tax=Arion vulgaris TaxID=1028688 RepID=A0A0B7A8W2_9EUPU
MSADGEKRGKKRTKAFYRKSTYGGKCPRSGSNVLEPGIKGFLIMCNSNESIAVKESYNILNEYADNIYGQEQSAGKSQPLSEDDSECEDVEKAMKKEIDSIKNITTSTQRRFQNVLTKAKNCVFIRSTVADPVKVVVSIMEDIAQRGLKKARYAARMLPIIATCKAHTSDIEKLAKDVLCPIFSKENANVPLSYTVMFKARNNNTSTCSKTSVIPVLTKAVSDINPSVKFSWSDFEVAILVEVVCTVCCLGVAPNYIRLRKYNLQELLQGPRTARSTEGEMEVCDEKCADKSLVDEKTDSNVNTTAFDKIDNNASITTSEKTDNSASTTTSEKTDNSTTSEKTDNVGTITSENSDVSSSAPEETENKNITSENMTDKCSDQSVKSAVVDAQEAFKVTEDNSLVIDEISRENDTRISTSGQPGESNITLTSESVSLKCFETEMTSSDSKVDPTADTQANIVN